MLSIILAQGPAPDMIMPDNDAPARLYDLEIIVANLLRFSIPLLGIAAFVVITLAGYKFITAGDDPKKAQAARSALTMAIAGLVLAALAFLIIRTIGVFTGSSALLENFRIYR